MLVARSRFAQVELDALLPQPACGPRCRERSKPGARSSASYDAGAANGATKLGFHAETTLAGVAFEGTRAGVIVGALQNTTRKRDGEEVKLSRRATFLLEKRHEKWASLFAEQGSAA